MMVLRFQRVTPIVSPQLTRPDDIGGHMGTAAKPTRENRTITVDFRDEATYFRLIKDGKAFVEFVIAFLLRFEYKISHAPGADISRECPGAYRCLEAHP
jgi:hypothetical protein